MKLACVVHRFGADIAGGSEAHCRAVAQHLAARHDVTILTTCAKDHVTWANHYPAGESKDGGLTVRRFPVARPRDLRRFLDLNDLVLDDGDAPAEAQEAWFRENGPDAPALLEHLAAHGDEFDLVLFWTYRYATSYFGVPLVKARAVLVPTAEADRLVHVEAARRLLGMAAGNVLLTPEEADLLRGSLAPDAPTCVIGCGLDEATVASRAPVDAAHVSSPYLLYLGRVDPNKGCQELFNYFLRYEDEGGRLPLVLAGPVNMPIPEHPLIRSLGYVDELTRESLLQHAHALVMPSFLESLSMVLLEAWNHGVPALVNAHCAVLKGQVRRADAGLHYSNAAEFVESTQYLVAHPDVARRLGAQGRAYVDREYRWPSVMGRLEPMLAAVAGSASARARR